MVWGMLPGGRIVKGGEYPKELPCDHCTKPIPIEQWDEVERHDEIYQIGFLCRRCRDDALRRMAEG